MSTEQNSVTFLSVVGLENEGPFASFKEACADMFKRIDAIVQAGSMSYMMLETCCWLERIAPDGTKKAPLLFYDTRDFCHKVGLLAPKDAPKSQQDVPEPSAMLVDRLFDASMFGFGNAEAFIELLPHPAPL